MRATNDRLSEKYIVVVARELAKALKGLHEAGIMHRDVKGICEPREMDKFLTTDLCQTLRSCQCPDSPRRKTSAVRFRGCHGPRHEHRQAKNLHRNVALDATGAVDRESRVFG